MRSKWAQDDVFAAVLVGLTDANRLAVEVSVRYGMRIGDVLAMTTDGVRRSSGTYYSYREQKTGKRRRVRLANELINRLLGQAGRVYVFEHRLDVRRHRTRQSVYKDIRRVADALRLGRGITCHTARKKYAVSLYKTTHDLKKVQRLLNHSDEAVTMIYAFADEMESVKNGKKQ